MNGSVVIMVNVTTTTATAICVLGGFYAVQLKSGLHLVMLNSNLWYSRDRKTANQTDPAGQFAWFENVLRDAEKHNTLVSFYKLVFISYLLVGLLIHWSFYFCQGGYIFIGICCVFCSFVCLLA